MGLLSKVFRAHLSWVFVLVLGIFWLALMGGVVNNRSNIPSGELTSIQPPRIAPLENLGQRLAELNSAINQSMAWEGAGFKASQIKALDQRITKDLDRFAADLQAEQARPGLTSAQTDLLKQIQMDFAGYQKTALDALDIRTGMLGNAASFMTVIDSRYAEISEHLSQLRVVERALSVAPMEQGKVLAHRDTQWVIGIALVAASLAMLWLGKRFFTSRLKHATRLASSNGQAGTNMLIRELVGRVHPATNEDRFERLSRIIEDLRRAKQPIDRLVGSPPRAMPADSVTAKAAVDGSATADVAGKTESIGTLISQTCQLVDQATPAINAVAQELQMIDDRAQKIAQTIGVFDLIAFQTNVLALSAADKSALPGEQRKDAAAMAQEWSSLAKTGRDAAKEIRGLFSGLLAQVRTGTAHAQTAGDAMARIAGSVRQVSIALQHIPHVVSGRHTGWGKTSRRSQKRAKAANQSPPWWNSQHQWNMRHSKNKTSN